MPGRRFSDGLHQALEAKEGVTIEGETQTLATITLQNYFRMYEKLAGMTGTAETEADEFAQDLQAGRGGDPHQRAGAPGRLRRPHLQDASARSTTPSSTRSPRLHEQGLPGAGGHDHRGGLGDAVSRMLKRRGIAHNVLNAKHHQQEAEIVARRAGAGAVTIATNMAGRGTDIKLGSAVVKCDECGIGTGRRTGRPRTAARWTPTPCEADEPCGLHIIGTERHESPPHRPPAARPRRPPGRPRLVAFLPLARGRPDAPVRPRAHRRRHGPAGRAGGRGHHAPAGDQGHRDARRSGSRSTTSTSASACSSTTT